MSIGIIIQAREGSSRLKNKMTLPFYQSKGILEFVLDRLISADLGIPIIMATTIEERDDKLVEIANRYKIKTFRGEEDNVLNRFILAAKESQINKIIRVCADNPFLDIESIRQQIIDFKFSDNDYLCYCTSGSKPTILTHYGFWTEGVTLKALLKTQQKTIEPIHLEHVTNYIYSNPTEFTIQSNEIPLEIEKREKIRLTVDTIDDFNLASRIANDLISENNTISLESIVNYLDKNPDFENIMIKQILNNSK